MATHAVDVIHAHASLAARHLAATGDLLHFTESYVQDIARKRGPGAAASMFWMPGEEILSAEKWLKVTGADLAAATTYQVTEEMCAAVNGTYQRTKKTLKAFFEVELPSTYGFTWLDEPVSLIDRQGKSTAVRAVSWAPVTGLTHPAIRLTIWSDWRLSDDYLNGGGADSRAAEHRLGRLVLLHTLVLRLGTELEFYDDSTTSVKADNHVAWFRVLCLFLGTELAATEKRGLPRAVKASASKSLKKPAVTVVTLRRIASEPEHGNEPESVAWSCRWPVQGHYRHLDAYSGEHHHALADESKKHCETCGSRVTWIPPYIKGPDGLPLRAAPVVYRLSR